MYSKLYYSDRILPAVKERVETGSENRRNNIAVIREVTKKMYEEEDEEIKAIVATKVATAQAEPSDEGIGEDSPRTPQQYQE